MTVRLGLALIALIAAGPLTASPAGATHLAAAEGGLHATTLRCLVGINKEFHTIQSALDFPEPGDGRSAFIAIQAGTPTLPGETPQITFADIRLARFENFQNAGIVFQGVGPGASSSRRSSRPSPRDRHERLGPPPRAASSSATGPARRSSARTRRSRSTATTSSTAAGPRAPVAASASR
jgi:hypothetical protein